MMLTGINETMGMNEIKRRIGSKVTNHPGMPRTVGFSTESPHLRTPPPQIQAHLGDWSLYKFKKIADNRTLAIRKRRR